MTTYKDTLRPWAIFRHGTVPHVCVAKFKRRTDADAYMSILYRVSTGVFSVAYAPNAKSDAEGGSLCDHHGDAFRRA